MLPPIVGQVEGGGVCSDDVVGVFLVLVGDFADGSVLGGWFSWGGVSC